MKISCLLVCVDDMLIAINDKCEIDHLKSILKSKYKMSIVVDMKNILGMEMKMIINNIPCISTRVIIWESTRTLQCRESK